MCRHPPCRWWEVNCLWGSVFAKKADFARLVSQGLRQGCLPAGNAAPGRVWQRQWPAPAVTAWQQTSTVPPTILLQRSLLLAVRCLLPAGDCLLGAYTSAADAPSPSMDHGLHACHGHSADQARRECTRAAGMSWLKAACSIHTEGDKLRMERSRPPAACWPHSSLRPGLPCSVPCPDAPANHPVPPCSITCGTI